MRRTLIAGILLMTGVATTSAVRAGEPVLLHSAGSLRAALTEVAEAFTAQTAVGIKPVFGASGLLKDRIAGGERAEVFASADLGNPQALAKAGLSGPVVLFARNELCAYTRPEIVLSPETLLERMLDPGIKLGTSTPKADPSGDYAFQVFARAEAVRPGARAALEAKALQLTGSANSTPAPDGANVYGHKLAKGEADIFLAYCTNAAPIAKEQPGLKLVRLPPALSVGADYGLTVTTGASPQAWRFAMFVLAQDGQAILARHGFAAPTLPRDGG